MTTQVYALWFVKEQDDAADIELLIGVYESETAARGAIDRVKNKPGFVDFPAGFQIHPYVIGRDSWTEGFVKTE
jgi:homoserine kinase type II